MEIKMPRGDIREVRFQVTDDQGNPSRVNFSEIYFTVKKSFNAQDYLFQKRLSDGDIVQLGDGDYQFTIKARDTNELQITSYVFDIEVIYGTQIKQTFVGKLTLTNEVTFVTNEGGL